MLALLECIYFHIFFAKMQNLSGYLVGRFRLGHRKGKMG